MRTILIDASSAILLFKSGLFDELTGMFQTYMTDTVYGELTHDGYPGTRQFKRLHDADKFSVIPADRNTSETRERFSDLDSLDRGERDTIRHFSTGGYHFIVIDDGKGAGYCRDHGIPYINALLFPKIMFFTGDLTWDGCLEKMNRIIEVGRYSKKIIDFALECSQPDLEYFLPRSV